MIGTAKKRETPGFTLIEMLLVVAILVALAALILPKLDREQLRANEGIAASNIHGVSRYIQTFRIRNNLYPDRWDSLLTSGGALWTPTSGTGIDPQLTGGPPAGSPTKLAVDTLTEGTDHFVRSLTRMGITTILNLPATPSGSPGSAFTAPATIADGTKVATVNASDDDGKAIIDQIYPDNKLPGGVSGTVPAGKKLVVFGFGPLNTAIGDVLQECPTYSNTDHTKYYDRFLAIFECSASGSRAELKLVVGADADRLQEEIGDYYEK